MSASTPASTTDAPARARRAAKPAPVRSDTYARLDLDALRAYRSRLQDEEGRVSYWRRILQARLDVVQAGDAPRGRASGDVIGSGSGFEASRLAPVLTDERVGRGRAALVDCMPVDDIPPLPSLGELWDRRVSAGDVEGQAALRADLVAAEEQLSSYRSALHRRLEEATEELIARYRETPLLALAALPLGVPQARRATG